MAISRSWAQRAADYAGSTRNIVGSVAGLAALGVTVPTHIAGPLWPVVVGGIYGIGALLAPREKVTLVDPGLSSAVARAQSLRDDLARLGERVRRYDRRLPDDVLAAYGRIEMSLEEILLRAEDLATSPDHLFVVGQTIDDYLPNALETYANLPRALAMRPNAATRRTAHDDLMATLELLDAQLGEVAEAVYAGDMAALSAQGRFLQDKFRASSLDL